MLAVGLTALTALLAVFALGAADPVVAVPALVGVGLVGGTMNPAMVIRVMRTANARPLVNTVHTAVITTGVLVGSSLGGLAISAGYGLTAPSGSASDSPCSDCSPCSPRSATPATGNGLTRTP